MFVFNSKKGTTEFKLGTSSSLTDPFTTLKFQKGKRPTTTTSNHSPPDSPLREISVPLPIDDSISTLITGGGGGGRNTRGSSMAGSVTAPTTRGGGAGSGEKKRVTRGSISSSTVEKMESPSKKKKKLNNTTAAIVTVHNNNSSNNNNNKVENDNGTESELSELEDESGIEEDGEEDGVGGEEEPVNDLEGEEHDDEEEDDEEEDDEDDGDHDGEGDGADYDESENGDQKPIIDKGSFYFSFLSSRRRLTRFFGVIQLQQLDQCHLQNVQEQEVNLFQQQ